MHMVFTSFKYSGKKAPHRPRTVVDYYYQVPDTRYHILGGANAFSLFTGYGSQRRASLRVPNDGFAHCAAVFLCWECYGAVRYGFAKVNRTVRCRWVKLHRDALRRETERTT